MQHWGDKVQTRLFFGGSNFFLHKTFFNAYYIHFDLFFYVLLLIQCCLYLGLVLYFFQMTICRKGGWARMGQDTASVPKHTKRESSQSKRKTRYIKGPLDRYIKFMNKLSRPFFYFVWGKCLFHCKSSFHSHSFDFDALRNIVKQLQNVMFSLVVADVLFSLLWWKQTPLAIPAILWILYRYHTTFKGVYLLTWGVRFFVWII